MREGDPRPSGDSAFDKGQRARTWLRVPNKWELATQFDTSRAAVCQALGIIDREGLVHSCLGAGTFLFDDARPGYRGWSRLKPVGIAPP